jgi:hydroxyacylglutathione hydrolase
MTDLAIFPILCLRDNYAYLISAPATGEAWLVDPSEADPLLHALADLPNMLLRGIVATHHHPDHVAGIETISRRASADHAIWVAGHAHDRGRIPLQTVFVEAPQGRFAPTGIDLAGVELAAMHVPGHTRGAIAWCIPQTSRGPAAVFTGDTLFAAGCGRLFEGTPQQMHASLQAIMAMPDATLLYFGHEYTAQNLEFAATAEPGNRAIAARMRSLEPPTTPTTVAEERATNPFVRASSVEEFARRRRAKDTF